MNKIIELDPDFDLFSISPEDLLDQLGLSGLTIDELLSRLKTGALEIKKAWETKLYQEQPDGMKQFHGLGKKHAPTAYAVYDLLRRADKEPRMTVYLISNRTRSVECSPNSVIFWDNTDVIYGLFKALEKDGYYAST
jgi:hypothetical protein